MKIEISVNVNAPGQDRANDTFDISLSDVRVRDLKELLDSLPIALAKCYAGIAPTTLLRKEITPQKAEDFILEYCSQ